MVQTLQKYFTQLPLRPKEILSWTSVGKSPKRWKKTHHAEQQKSTARGSFYPRLQGNKTLLQHVWHFTDEGINILLHI